MQSYLELTSEEQLQNLYNQSDEQAVVIFKHSTRCPISHGAASEMDKVLQKPPQNIAFARVLVVENRSVSLRVAKDLAVRHESPQVIILKNKEVLFRASHRDITEDRVLNEIKKLEQHV